MKLLLQFPEGLKREALFHVRRLEEEGHIVYLSGSKCYGGCDVAFEEAEALGVDKIIHFGHSKFPLNPFVKDRYKNISVEYVEYPIDIDMQLIIELSHFLIKKGLVRPILATTVQHVHQLDEVKSILRKHSGNVIVPVTGTGIFTAHEAQVLGCDVSAVSSVRDKGDCIVYIGGGRFHYLVLDIERACGVTAEQTSLPVVEVNPFTKEIRDVTGEVRAHKKKRQGVIVKASEAKTFGILVSTKAGQFRPEVAEDDKRKFDELGRRVGRTGITATIIVSRDIDWEALQDFDVFEAFVNTACPRLSEDWERVGKPIINLDELKLLFELIENRGR